MSIAKPRRVAALAVGCMKCGVGPGFSCEGVSGARKSVHRERMVYGKAGPKSFVAARTKHEFYDGPEWRRVRYEALRIHGAKCQCCGVTRRAGAVIHVDHILPRSRHPELALDVSNLQVLCADCNLGKAAHDSTDWRGA